MLADKTPEEKALEESKRKGKRWREEIRLAKKYFEKWETDSQKIVDRYRDEETNAQYTARVNIFWASLENMKPSTLSRSPKAECERRFKDGDPNGRLAAMILERAIDSSIDGHQDFLEVAKQARDDYFLPGRGVLRERYVPYHEQTKSRVNLQISSEPGCYQREDGSAYDGEEKVDTDDQGPFITETSEALVYEESVTDYVFWRDFLHNPTRMWSEVRWVAYRAFMTRDEIVQRFGKQFKDIKLDHMPKDVDDDKAMSDAQKEEFKKAGVWEIWDKTTKKVYWVTESEDRLLDEKPDFLKLKNFFPSARPLYATMTSGKMIPRAFFTMVSHQADEVDRLTTRMAVHIDALRVVCVCPPDISELLDLFKKDNAVIALKEWATFVERGGFKGILDWIPLEPIVAAIKQDYEAREVALQKFYEVSGWSDIMRGATDPRETATAQGIKSQYGSKRVGEYAANVQRLLRDQLAIKGEIIAEHFQPETIRMMTGVDFLPEGNGVENFDQALALLKNDTIRCYRIDVETDSTIALDEQAEQEKRTEFTEAMTQLIAGAVPIIKETPQLAKLVKEICLFNARGFKAGRGLEGAIEESFDALIQAGEQAAQNPQPDPETMKVQADAQAEQGRQQIEQGKLQVAGQKVQADAQVKGQKSAADVQLAIQKQQTEAALVARKQDQDAQAQAIDQQLEQMRLELDAQKEANKAEMEKYKADLQAAVQLQIAEGAQKVAAMKQSAESTGSSGGE